ncbi:MAG: hypothetical protein KGJ43_05030, partial [Acidobacteriota bacterium]|nr:hypothetical protein [Acidobacteriota bacterium]
KTFLANLRAFAEEPAVETALEALTRTAGLGSTVVGGIAPEQANCNYVTLTFRNIASLLATDIGVGTVARVETVLAPSGPNAEGGPASAPASGPSPELRFGPQYNDNFLHANPYPNVTGPGQPAKLCEAANEVYEAGRTVIGHARRAGAGLEPTKRETSLLNETYPAATLRALGIGTEKKAKGKGKKK